MYLWSSLLRRKPPPPPVDIVNLATKALNCSSVNITAIAARDGIEARLRDHVKTNAHMMRTFFLEPNAPNDRHNQYALNDPTLYNTVRVYHARSLVAGMAPRLLLALLQITQVMRLMHAPQPYMLRG